MPSKNRGAIVAFEEGETNVYGLHNAQEHGTLFVGLVSEYIKG